MYKPSKAIVIVLCVFTVLLLINNLYHTIALPDIQHCIQNRYGTIQPQVSIN